MSMALKCPNPSCPYLFDPSTVPPGVVLACPRCGMRFTLGAPTTAAPAPPTTPAGIGDATVTYPGGPPGAFPPVAPAYPPPGYSGAALPADPTQMAFGEMTPDAARPDGSDGPRLPVRESPFQTTLLLGVVAVALAAAGVAVWFKMTQKPETERSDPVIKVDNVNLGIEPPPAPWAQDAETRGQLDAPYVLVFKRDNPEAYMAFGARDYQTREPRPSELRDELVRALNKLIDPTTRREFAEDAPKTWMGQDARGFKFSGLQWGGGSLEGEALAISYRGVAYWFLSWTGSDQYAEQQSAFADGRGRCKFLDLRTNWKPKHSSIATYKNTEVGYTVRDPDGTWVEIDDESRKKDEAADKLLTLAVGNKKNRQLQGTLLIYVLPGGDPLTEARSYVTARRSDEIKKANPDFDVQFTERTDPPAESPTNTVEKSSDYVRLQSRVKNAAGQDRLHVISATKAGDKVVVAHAWCNWDERDDLEAIFIQIVGSLKADR